jgi:hypothetical protein
MKALRIIGTNERPSIVFDKDSGEFTIFGKMYDY